MAAHSYSIQTDKSYSFNASVYQTMFQVVGASFFMGCCSQIKIILPYTFIPITFQTLAVLLIGATLGSRKGFYALLVYYVEILMGMPVLSGGSSDPLIFLGPKGGYVLGWCLQSFLMGWFIKKKRESGSLSLLVGGLLACSVEMGIGVGVLAGFIGWNHAISLGLYPFVPGEILKVLLMCYIVNSLSSLKFSLGRHILAFKNL